MVDQTILIVEDDAYIRGMVAEALTDAGYWIQEASTARSAIRVLKEETVNLILLDLLLEEGRGDEVLRFIRRQNPLLPVIAISNTPALDARIDIINQGADDFLMKPFHVQELLIRIKRCLQRSIHHARVNPAFKANLAAGGLTLDYENACLRFGEREISLQGKLFDIAEFFMNHPGIVISKKELRQKLWAGEPSSENSLYVYVHKLREILRKNCDGQAILKLVYGKGYCLTIHEK